MAWTVTDLGILPGGTFSRAFAVSSDGTVIVGDSNTEVLGQAHAVRWTSAGGLQDLGLLPGGLFSSANAVSADGAKVVGQADDGTGAPVAFLWTQADGMISLGFLGSGQQSIAYGISADGTEVVGYSYDVPNDMSPEPVPFKWTFGGGMVSLGVVSGNTGNIGLGASEDGTTVALGSGVSGDVPGVWTSGDGSVALTLPVDYSTGSATSTSLDGSIIAGFNNSTISGNAQATLWSTPSTPSLIGFLGAGDLSFAYGISGDGSAIAGSSNIAPAGQLFPYYWTDVDGFVALPPLNEDAPSGNAFGISQDGAIVVGVMSGLEDEPEQHAVFWSNGPGVPIDLAVDDATTTTLTATWSPGSGPTPDSYTLRYRLDPAGSWTTITGILVTTRLVAFLTPATTYDFEVEAIIGVEESGFTDQVVASTLSVTPAIAIPLSLGRWRGQVGINWQGLALVGDAFANVVGLSDFRIFTEYGNGMQMLVTTPPLHDDRKRIIINRFEIEMEAGEGLPDDPETAPQMMLDYSKDGGKTFVELQMFRSMGAIGEYIKRLRWINLGQARTWIFRLRYSDAARPAIIGSYWTGAKGLG